MISKKKITLAILPTRIMRWYRRKSLHKLIAAKDWHEVRKSLDTSYGQRKARKIDFTGLTALTEAVSEHAPTDVIKKLVEIYPEAVSLKDCRGSLPLHLVVASGGSEEVKKLIIDTYPEALFTRDLTGKTPFQYIDSYTTEPKAKTSTRRTSVASVNFQQTKVHNQDLNKLQKSLELGLISASKDTVADTIHIEAMAEHAVNELSLSEKQIALKLSKGRRRRCSF